MLYSSKSTFLTFSSQFPTNSVNLTKFLPFLYMRNKYLWGILSSHENYHIPTMRNGKTTEILSSLLWDSHKILWGIFVRALNKWNPIWSNTWCPISFLTATNKAQECFYKSCSSLSQSVYSLVWYKTKFGSQNLATKFGNHLCMATKIGSQC